MLGATGVFHSFGALCWLPLGSPPCTFGLQPSREPSNPQVPALEGYAFPSWPRNGQKGQVVALGDDSTALLPFVGDGRELSPNAEGPALPSTSTRTFHHPPIDGEGSAVLDSHSVFLFQFVSIQRAFIECQALPGAEETDMSTL